MRPCSHAMRDMASLRSTGGKSRAVRRHSSIHCGHSDSKAMASLAAGLAGSSAVRANRSCKAASAVAGASPRYASARDCSASTVKSSSGNKRPTAGKSQLFALASRSSGFRRTSVRPSAARRSPASASTNCRKAASAGRSRPVEASASRGTGFGSIRKIVTTPLSSPTIRRGPLTASAVIAEAA